MKLVGRLLAKTDVEAICSTVMLLRSLLGLQFSFIEPIIPAFFCTTVSVQANLFAANFVAFRLLLQYFI